MGLVLSARCAQRYDALHGGSAEQKVEGTHEVML